MSELELWNLTTTERRIAEVAFAAGEGNTISASAAVLRLRGNFERGPTYEECEAMLAELRREPASPCDEHDHRIARLVEGHALYLGVADAAKYDGPLDAKSLSEWFARCHARHAIDSATIARYRALLERVEANAIDDEWLVDVREELGR